MAKVIKPYKKAGQKIIIHCDIPNEEGCNCANCVHCCIKDPWCDHKCYYPNHVVNDIMPGLVCEDFEKRKTE